MTLAYYFEDNWMLTLVSCLRGGKTIYYDSTEYEICDADIIDDQIVIDAMRESKFTQLFIGIDGIDGVAISPVDSMPWRSVVSGFDKNKNKLFDICVENDLT